MATSRPSLDSGPPLPPSLQPAPQASVAGLAGQPPANPNGSASLQQSVLEKLMSVEQTLKDIGTMLPAAAPAVDGLIGDMRLKLGKIVTSSAQPPAPGQTPGQLTIGPAPAGIQ